ncbi:MAG TPA: CheR family methyltransferase [Chitinophagaceae bacterium]
MQEARILISDEQVEILQQDFLEFHGYDFTQYSMASFKRRIQRLFSMNKGGNFKEFRKTLQHDDGYFFQALTEISVNVTEMFRDAAFYRTIREKVIPVLATYPHIRVWHAGCATGEEVYSLAIMLHEGGILHKSLLYGTDINPIAIEKARMGIFSVGPMQQYSKNYHDSGGMQDFSSYYTANYGIVKFNTDLSQKIIFSTHNLVSDFSFNSFQLIFCRNVLIYFEKNLQAKVLRLFDSSLEPLGFLALGSKESIRFSPLESSYQAILEREKIWRKLK